LLDNGGLKYGVFYKKPQTRWKPQTR